ncbi:MAG: hypothetical protein AB8H86_10145 [Polyangiales bacterium]
MSAPPMPLETIPRRSASFPIVAAIALAIGGAFMFRDYYALAMEHMSEGLYTTEQVFGLVAGVLFFVASVVALLRFPERLEVEPEGLTSAYGVFGTLRRVRPKATIQTLSVHTRQVRSNNLNVIVSDVWIDGSAGNKRLCRFPSKESADALAARCAELWGAKVVPWS